jgi:nucleotide-binding universal stress UspA family protein
MYRKIIVGYDASETAEDALALGQAIGQATGAELVVVGVFPDGPLVDPEQQTEFAHRVQAAADLVGWKADAFPSNSPARGLHDAAEALDADLIVLGSAQGTRPGHISAGDVGVQLLHGSPCAVAVAPTGLRRQDVGLGTIGVALDGSTESEHALEAAIELSRATGARLRLMTACVLARPASASGWGYGVFDLGLTMSQIFQERLDEAAKRVPEDIDVQTELLDGGPPSALLSEAAERVDLLCLGSRGYGPICRVLLGSVSTRLVKHAPCAVLVVPRGAATESTYVPREVAVEQTR